MRKFTVASLQIASSLSVALADLRDLHIVPLTGEDSVMASPHGKGGLVIPTAVWRGLVALVEQSKPRVVVLA